MLYDPNWQKPKVADVFSLESLIAWLETKDPDAWYSFNNCKGACMLDQYANAMRIPRSFTRYSDLDRAFDGEAGYRIAVERPHTFGAALTRARKAAQAS